MSELTGPILKMIREQRQIPLEEIASATHIRLELLRDLEDGEYESIASQAQRKGFISLYSDYLKLSPEEIKTALETFKDEPKLIQPGKPAAPKAEAIPPTAEDALEEVSEDHDPEPVKPKEEKAVPEAKAPERPSLKSVFTKPAKQQKEDEKPIHLAEGSRAHAILVEIGKELTERRRYLNISWELITDQVRIPKDQLQALERGDLAYFNNSMQAKGYLQNYAQFLNLDKDSIMVRYADALQLHRSESLKTVAKPYKEPKVLSPLTVALKKFFTLDLFFGSFLIIGMLAFLIWGMARMANTKSEAPAQPSLPALAEVLAETPLPELTIVPESPLATEQAAVPPGVEATPLPTVTPLYIKMDTQDPVHLVLIPNSREWSRIIVDGEEVFRGRLPAGRAVQYTATDGVLLETGNAAAFRAILNDAEIPSLGSIGSIIRVNFTAAGMVPIEGPLPTQEPNENDQSGQTPTPLPTPNP